MNLIARLASNKIAGMMSALYKNDRHGYFAIKKMDRISQDEARIIVIRTLDELFGEHIETIVAAAEEPMLRPQLRRLFFELAFLHIALNKPKTYAHSNR